MSVPQYQYAKIGEFLVNRQIHSLCSYLTQHETDAPYYQELMHCAFKQIITRCKGFPDFAELTATKLVELGLNIDDTETSKEHLLSVAIRSDDHVMFDFLMKQDIDMNKQDYEGKTPFYVATILSRKPAFVEKLIKAGIDITQPLPEDLQSNNIENIYDLAMHIDQNDHLAFPGDKRQVITLLKSADQMQQTINLEKQSKEKQKQLLRKYSRKPTLPKRR